MSGIRFNFKGEAIKRDAKSRTLCTTKGKSFYGNMCKLTQCGGWGEVREKNNKTTYGNLKMIEVITTKI